MSSIFIKRKLTSHVFTTNAMIVLAKVLSAVITSVGSYRHSVDTNPRLPLTYHMHVAMQNSYEYVKHGGSATTFFAKWNCLENSTSFVVTHDLRDLCSPFRTLLTTQNCELRTRTWTSRLPVIIGSADNRVITRHV